MRPPATLDPAGEPDDRKRTRIGFWVPATIIGFIALTLAGTYYVRLLILERTMSSAMELDDNAMITDLAFSWPCPVNARDKFSRTPLHWAARSGRMDLVKHLLSKGADVHTKEMYGYTALHWTAYAGHRETAELLIAKGADVNAKDRNRWTPLDVAAQRGYKETAKLLIAKDTNINGKDAYGRTPLHSAAWGGDKDIVELLIAKGADLAAKGNDGKTALRIAVEQRRDAVADILRKAGAKE